jgi:sugar lactone lactonase YvrE
MYVSFFQHTLWNDHLHFSASFQYKVARGFGSAFYLPFIHFVFVVMTLFVVTTTTSTTYAQLGIVTTVAGDGTGGFLDGTGVMTQFNTPIHICSDGAGNLYVADHDNNCIRRIVIATGVVSTFAGNGTNDFLDGIGTAARFRNPIGICSDGAGNLYVADYNNHRIRKIEIATAAVTTVAGDGTNGFLDATGIMARFNLPTGICTDGSGNLYVADLNNRRIRRINIATGNVTTLAGSTAGFADGIGTAAQFNTPYNICSDGAGSLYVADVFNHRVRRIDIATAAVTTLAGNGTAGFADGIGTSAILNTPYGVISDGAGNLYVAGDNRIRRIVIATGAVTTLAGSTAGFANGTGVAALFNQPRGLCFEGSNTLYIPDVSGHRIRAITVAAASGAISGTVFPEAAANNGSITATQDVTISGDTWLPTGTFAIGTDYTVTGLPAGIGLVVNRVSATVARVLFMGNAAAHAAANSTTVVLKFLDPAFTAGIATAVMGVEAVGVRGISLALNFNDPNTAPTSFTAATPPAGTVGAAYSYTFIADGFPAPTYSVFSGTLPPGLTLNTTTGELSGTPTSAGTFGPIVIRATNVAGNLDAASLSLVVRPLPPPPPPTVLTITDFSPSTGGDGTVLRIRGTNLHLTRSVNIGGQPATNLQIIGDSLVLATVQGGRTGQIQIISTENFVATSKEAFTYIPPPVPQITGYTPVSGGYQTVVTINGQNFRGAEQVFFGNFPALSFVVNSDNSITAVVGAGVAGPVDVMVVNANGRNGFFGFTYTTPPTPRILRISEVRANGTTATVAFPVSFPVSDDDALLRVEATGVVLPGAQILVDSMVASLQPIAGLAEIFTLRIPAAAQRIGTSILRIVNPDGQTTSATLRMMPPVAPQILALTPSVTTASFQAFTARINGVGFFRAARLSVNNASRTTARVVNSTAASVTFTEEDNRRATAIVLRLTNPDGQFTEATVRIQNPFAPQILHLSVRANPQDTSSILLVVDGMYFGTSPRVVLSGVGLRVMSARATQIVAVIPRELRRRSATMKGLPAVVVVFNPDDQFDGRRWYVEEPSDAVASSAVTDEERLNVASALRSEAVADEEAGGMDVYPNPSTGEFTVTRMFSEPVTVRLTLRTMLGQEVWSGSYTLQAGVAQQVLDVRALGAGMYLLHINTDTHQWFRTIVKR